MKRLLIAAAMTVAFAGAAQAQMAPPNPDLDRDGKVTLAEFKKTQVDAMLGRLDADKDGRISKDEMQAMNRMAGGQGGRADAMWARRDANGDGFMSRAEIEAAAAGRFQRGDTNKDGWLSKGELLTLRQNRGRDAG